MNLCPDNAQGPSWAERAYTHLLYFTEARGGGHFAAWEQPAIFADEVRAAFQLIR